MVKYIKGIKYRDYIALCRTEEHDEDEYLELHHYKPKSLFPELINDPENLVYLTPEEHVIAHYLLSNEYPKPETIRAINTMCPALIFGVDYTSNQVNLAAIRHGNARRRAHENQCTPQVLIKYPEMRFIKQFSSKKIADERMKDLVGYAYSTICNKKAPYRIIDAEDYFNDELKPINSVCKRTTPFAVHEIPVSFSNIEQAAECIGVQKDRLMTCILMSEELEQENNKWTFEFAY